MLLFPLSQACNFGILIFLASALASGAGTGGGALYMPVYVMKYRGDTHSAVPLSKATIFGLAVAALISNTCRKDPKSKYKQLLNTPIAALLEAPTLLGAILGVNLNIILPSRVILFLLIVSLSITAFITFKKAKRLYLIEKSSQLNIADEEVTNNYELSRPLLLSSYSIKQEIEQNDDSLLFVGQLQGQEMSPVFSESTNVSPDIQVIEDFSAREKLVDEPQLSQSLFTIFCTLFLILNWGIHWVTLFLAGGPAALICGSSFQKSLMYFLTGFHLVCITSYIAYLRNLHKTNKINSTYEESTFYGGLEWISSTKKLCWYCICALFAGLAAGALGIGGGLIKGPLMLQIGLNPLSAVSTASLMLLFTSSSTTLSYALTGQLNLMDALNFGLISFCGSLVGIWLVNSVVKKKSYQSFISFLLFFVILISMVCLTSLTIASSLLKQGEGHFILTEKTTYPLKHACETLTQHSM